MNNINIYMSSEIDVYEPLVEVQSIVSTLVENIYNDTSYQDYLKDLKEVDTATSTKKYDLISKTFTDIQVFNTNKNPLFLISDIGIILAASNINTMTKSYTNTEKITGMLLINDKLVKKVFLTKYGVYRIMLTNKSKLSEIFRAFIYKLLDHMEVHGKDLTRELMDEVDAENPELINEAMIEYNNNLAKYKHLYEMARNERNMLKITIEANHTLYKDVEEEKNAIEIKQNYNVMYIEQLKKERKLTLDKMYNIKNDNNLDETVVALEYMKKKFYKEFTINLVQPNIMDEVFTSKKYPIDMLMQDYVVGEYKSDYDFMLKIFNKTDRISDEELLYVTLTLKVDKKEEDVQVACDYISDKLKFAELLEILKIECEHYHVPGSRKTSNNYIYKVSIEHIKSLTKNLIIL